MAVEHDERYHEISFTLTKDDFWHLQLHAYARRRPLQLAALVFYAVTIVIAGIALQSTLIFVAGAAFAVFLFGFAFFIMWLTALKSARALSKRGTHTITLTDAGIQLKNDQTDSLTRWHAITGISTDSHNLYLQLDNPGRVYIAIVIPRRAFKDAAAEEQFLAAVRTYRQR